jgi:hypothetical protein
VLVNFICQLDWTKEGQVISGCVCEGSSRIELHLS